MEAVVLEEKTWRLTPIHRLNEKSSRNRILWLFQCDCGNSVIASASDVKQGRKKSCGCLFKDRIKEVNSQRILPNKAGPINKLFGRYKREAKNRKLEFSLSKEQFIELIFKDCFYCGDKPHREYSIVKEQNKKEDNILIYNGIDRKNNTVGYNINNCVPCCYTCNKMKMEMNSDIFIKQINKIYRNINEGVSFYGEKKV